MSHLRGQSQSNEMKDSGKKFAGMSGIQKNFGTFSGGCAEFLWMYSVSMFFTCNIGGKALPVAVCFVIFWTAVAVTSAIRSYKLYVIVIVFVYAGLFALSLQWIFSLYFKAAGGQALGPVGQVPASGQLYGQASWFSWIDLLRESSTFIELLPFISVGFSIILLWTSGIYFSVKRRSYNGSLKVMESGVMAFFAVTLLQTALGRDLPGINVYILFFFVWSILAVMLHRTSHWGNEKNKGSKHFRMIVLFTFSILLMVVMIMTFFTDTLKWLAETGVFAAKAVSEPLEPYLIWFLRLLFGGAKVRQDSSTSGGGSAVDSNIIAESVGERGLLSVILEKLFFVAVGLIVLAIVVTMIGAIVKFLFTKRGGTAEHIKLRQLLSAWLHAVMVSFTYFFKNIKSVFFLWNRNEKTIVRVYKHLVRWGTMRGVYHEVYETPLEYVQKLTLKYVQYEDMFKQIISAYYREVYGEKQLSLSEIAEAKRNLRRLFVGGGPEGAGDQKGARRTSTKANTRLS